MKYKKVINFFLLTLTVLVLIPVLFFGTRYGYFRVFHRCKYFEICGMEYPQANLTDTWKHGTEYSYEFHTNDSFETVRNYYENTLPAKTGNIPSIIRSPEDTPYPSNDVWLSVENHVTKETTWVLIEQEEAGGTKVSIQRIYLL